MKQLHVFVCLQAKMVRRKTRETYHLSDLLPPDTFGEISWLSTSTSKTSQRLTSQMILTLDGWSPASRIGSLFCPNSYCNVPIDRHGSMKITQSSISAINKNKSEALTVEYSSANMIVTEQFLLCGADYHSKETFKLQASKIKIANSTSEQI